MSYLTLARSRWTTALAVVALSVGVLAGCGSDDESSSDDAAATATTATTATTSTETQTITTATTPAQTIQDAQEKIDEDDYAEALAIGAVLTAAEVNAIRRRISNRIAGRVRYALSIGDRSRARRLVLQGNKYPATSASRQARAQYRAARERAAEQARQRRAAAEARRQQRAAKRAAARERERQRQAAPPPSAGSSVPSGTCSEIPQKDFRVPPGDPRDRDGDGIACES